MSTRPASLLISYEDCAALYSYDPHTGEFTTVRQVTHLYPPGEQRPPVMRKMKAKGAPVPCLAVHGAVCRASHIAYLLTMKSLVPEGHGIFHRDRDTTNLKWSNLVCLPNSCGGKIPDA